MLNLLKFKALILEACLLLSTTVSLRVSVYLSFCLLVFVPVCLFLFIYLCICLSVYLSICLLVSVPICLFLSVYLCICLSVYLYLYQSVFVYLVICISVPVFISVYLSIWLFFPVLASAYLYVCTRYLSVYLFIGEWRARGGVLWRSPPPLETRKTPLLPLSSSESLIWSLNNVECCFGQLLTSNLCGSKVLNGAKRSPRGLYILKQNTPPPPANPLSTVQNPHSNRKVFGPQHSSKTKLFFDSNAFFARGRIYTYTPVFSPFNGSVDKTFNNNEWNGGKLPPLN